ncbi:MAG: acetyl-CoA carboxylase biotin carboxyl carrier protein subunit [Candidatus Thermoplasmatota archaeon]|nr:acetyl-CoA carboxylase biotin carboxyl carrier protein subunit [Candidatus Thermoplasmatota archaeon]MED6313248.1 acetyl-CoA carboxylase biotin carboxyl carrier protein subunit [Candidatus Thermoplasmatota archaeon]
MEWSIRESSVRYALKLSDSEGSLSLASLTRDGHEAPHAEISITRDSQGSRLLVDIDGSAQIAHVAKIGDDWWIHLDGRIHVVHSHEPGSVDSSAGEGGLTAPMPGTILEIHAKAGQRVREGQTLLVMEAMKMEHRIQAPKAGEVLSVNFSEGDRVDMGATLVELGD